MSELTQAQPGTVEFEAARVAAAFGVEAWEWYPDYPDVISCKSQGFHYYFQFDTQPSVNCISIAANEFFLDECEVRIWGMGAAIRWKLMLADKQVFNEFMARGLYCLGFTDEAILSQLPPLSAHEQMEARLSLPQEFWPQQWLDELAGRTGLEL